MAWTRHSRKELIIRRMSIGILESYRQRSSCRMSLKDAAHDRRPVGLDTRRRALRTALPSQDVLLEILLR